MKLPKLKLHFRQITGLFKHLMLCGVLFRISNGIFKHVPFPSKHEKFANLNSKFIESTLHVVGFV